MTKLTIKRIEKVLEEINAECNVLEKKLSRTENRCKNYRVYLRERKIYANNLKQELKGREKRKWKNQ